MRRISLGLKATFLVSLSLGWPLCSMATLIGDNISITAPGIPGGTTTVTAAAGTDLIFNDIGGLGEGPDEYITIDVGPNYIKVALFAQDNFWGWQPGIPDDPFVVAFTGIELFSNLNSAISSISTSVSGFFSPGLSAALVGPKSIDVLVPLSSFGATCGGQSCGEITINIEGSIVPEPNTAALFLAMLVTPLFMKGRTKPPNQAVNRTR
ncbi:MAG: hypothetical protein RIC85_04460 [Gammaproteobacteria bacterium]